MKNIKRTILCSAISITLFGSAIANNYEEPTTSTGYFESFMVNGAETCFESKNIKLVPQSLGEIKKFYAGGAVDTKNALTSLSMDLNLGFIYGPFSGNNKISYITTNLSKEKTIDLFFMSSYAQKFRVDYGSNPFTKRAAELIKQSNNPDNALNFISACGTNIPTLFYAGASTLFKVTMTFNSKEEAQEIKDILKVKMNLDGGWVSLEGEIANLDKKYQAKTQFKIESTETGYSTTAAKEREKVANSIGKCISGGSEADCTQYIQAISNYTFNFSDYVARDVAKNDQKKFKYTLTLMGTPLESSPIGQIIVNPKGIDAKQNIQEAINTHYKSQSIMNINSAIERYLRERLELEDSIDEIYNKVNLDISLKESLEKIKVMLSKSYDFNNHEKGVLSNALNDIVKNPRNHQREFDRILEYFKEHQISESDLGKVAEYKHIEQFKLAGVDDIDLSKIFQIDSSYLMKQSAEGLPASNSKNFVVISDKEQGYPRYRYLDLALNSALKESQKEFDDVIGKIYKEHNKGCVYGFLGGQYTGHRAEYRLEPNHILPVYSKLLNFIESQNNLIQALEQNKA
ncbi:hypothetical protein [Cysteiniphilum sp. 6C5]|uniref:hypothetical protein n=1 Tax=unclassified Cysteiniphilum TaxID=2610889 RepID=UPI003F860A36